LEKGKSKKRSGRESLLSKPESGWESIDSDAAWITRNPGAGNGIPIRDIYSPFFRNTHPQALEGNERDSTDYRSDIFCPVPVGVPGFPPKNVTPTLPIDS
jgi:hypothetical protein